MKNLIDRRNSCPNYRNSYLSGSVKVVIHNKLSCSIVGVFVYTIHVKGILLNVVAKCKYSILHSHFCLIYLKNILNVCWSKAVQ